MGSNPISLNKKNKYRNKYIHDYKLMVDCLPSK